VIRVDGVSKLPPRDVIRLAVLSTEAYKCLGRVEEELGRYGTVVCEEPRLEDGHSVIECTVTVPVGTPFDFVTTIRQLKGVSHVEILGSDPYVGA
jgi:hypothetical protein